MGISNQASDSSLKKKKNKKKLPECEIIYISKIWLNGSFKILGKKIMPSRSGDALFLSLLLIRSSTSCVSVTVNLILLNCSAKKIFWK